MPATQCRQCGKDVDSEEFVCPNCQGPGPAWHVREELRKRDRMVRYCFLAAGVLLLALYAWMKL